MSTVYHGGGGRSRRRHASPTRSAAPTPPPSRSIPPPASSPSMACRISRRRDAYNFVVTATDPSAAPTTRSRSPQRQRSAAGHLDRPPQRSVGERRRCGTHHGLHRGGRPTPAAAPSPTRSAAPISPAASPSMPPPASSPSNRRAGLRDPELLSFQRQASDAHGGLSRTEAVTLGINDLPPIAPIVDTNGGTDQVVQWRACRRYRPA